MASIHDDYLLALAPTFVDGENATRVCPECGKYGFSLARRNGMLLYHCFKAGCGFSGRVLLTGHSSLASQAQAVPQEERLTPYTGALVPVPPELADRLEARFGVSGRSILENMAISDHHYMLGIYRPGGGRRGWVKRQPWDFTGFGGWTPRGGPKSQIFKEKHEPMISWYSPAGNSVHTYTVAPTILVEDQMSAIKLADGGYTACALLGTSLNSEKVAEIQSVSKHIVIALDSDATATAFKLARKWQHGFSSCRVVILEKDVKDSSKEEIHAKFN